jgi:hypothetical protein
MAEARNHAETTCPAAHCQIPEDITIVKTSYLLPTILFVGSLCSFVRAKRLGHEAVSSAAVSEITLQYVITYILLWHYCGEKIKIKFGAFEVA